MGITTYRPLIESQAAIFDVPATFIAAIVKVESNGNPYAWNPEPRYRYLWDVKQRAPFRPLTKFELESEIPPADFPTKAGDRDQEWWGQAASWGLMQVMGAVAREQGFSGDYLTEMTDPGLNLYYGCKVIKGLVLWSGSDYNRVAAAYNAGRGGWRSPAGAAYALKVQKALKEVKATW